MKSPENGIDILGTSRSHTRFCKGLPLEREVENFKVLVSGPDRVRKVPLKWDREFSRFGKKPDHCV